MRGPTPWCNWVIKRHMLAGAYPASLDDRDTEDILSTLLEAGVTTFVCLQVIRRNDVGRAVPRPLTPPVQIMAPARHSSCVCTCRLKSASR